MQFKVTPALGLLMSAGLLVGCSVPASTAPAPAPTTPPPATASRTPTASASADPTDPAYRAKQALAAITAAAGSDAIGSLTVRPDTVEAMIVKGSAAQRWSLVNGVPVLGLTVARSAESASMPSASFPLEAVAQLRPATAECPADYVVRVQLLPSGRSIGSVACTGGENSTVVAQVLGGVRLRAVRDRYAPESLAEIFSEASAIAPRGMVVSIDLAGVRGEKRPTIAVALPAYDAGGYWCGPATWMRPLAAGDQGFLVPVACSGSSPSPSQGPLLAPTTLDPTAVLTALAEAKAQLGSDLSGATSVRLTMTDNGLVLQADDHTGAAPGSAYVRVV